MCTLSKDIQSVKLWPSPGKNPKKLHDFENIMPIILSNQNLINADINSENYA
jgi:hypothetical protein